VNVRGVVFLGLLFGLFAAIGSLFGVVGAALALSVAIVLTFWSYWSAGHELIRRLEASPVMDQRTLRIAGELARRAGIPVPIVYEVADRQPNAVAVGPSPDRSAIIITSGIRACLSAEELAAVLAHEIAHIRNKDIFAGTLAATCVSVILVLAVPLVLLGIILRRNGGGAIIAIGILVPFAGLILRFAMARSVEYRADRDAAYLCGDANQLILALSRMSGLPRSCELAIREPIFASMFFVDPLPRTWIGRLLSSHPPTEKRIARLLAMQQGDRYVPLLE
jgi:heat shock protein HtpX